MRAGWIVLPLPLPLPLSAKCPPSRQPRPTIKNLSTVIPPPTSVDAIAFLFRPRHGFMTSQNGPSGATTTPPATPAPTNGQARKHEEVESVTIRFAGDSGDGMQLAGTQFTNTSALAGNDIATFPDFPAEIRAPAGTLAGVSGFQVHFASTEIHTPGDDLNTLVAMNPAALKTNLKDLELGGILVVNSDAFGAGDLHKAGYKTNPLEDGSLKGYRVFCIPVNKLNRDAVAEVKLSPREADRCKNFF